MSYTAVGSLHVKPKVGILNCVQDIHLLCQVLGIEVGIKYRFAHIVSTIAAELQSSVLSPPSSVVSPRNSEFRF